MNQTSAQTKDLTQLDIAPRLSEIEKQLSELKERVPEDKVTIIFFSGDFDSAIAAFMLGTGASAMGMEVTMYFTFWGVSVIKKRKRLSRKRNFLQNMVNLMIPGNSKGLAPSKMAFGPIGARLFRHMMKGKFESLEGFVELAKEEGVKFVVCSPTTQLMGLEEDDFIVPTVCMGVGGYYEDALHSRVTLFI